MPESLFDVRFASHPSHSSLVIDRLKQDKNLIVAYFYFDFRDSMKQIVRGLLCSLVFQIATSSERCFAYLKREESKPRGLSHPTESELFDMLSQLMLILRNTPSNVVIIIDALDECHTSERENMFRFLRDVHNLKLENLRLLFTSRPETDIWEQMKDFAGADTYSLDFHDAGRHKDDLADYISAKLDSGSYRWGESVKMKAKQLLHERANGM